MHKAFLEIQNISKIYHRNSPSEVRALNDMSFSLHQGEFVTIIGSNAAGKSTLFRTIAGALQPDTGDIMLDGNSILRMPEHRRAGLIARVSQNPDHSLMPSLTLAENFALADIRGNRARLRAGVSHKLAEKCRTILAQVELGLEKRVHDKAALLSGGQKQVVALLMATQRKPKLLLLDEHTAALDPRVTGLVMKITRDMVRDYRITTLMITHNLSHALEYGDRLLLLDRGQVAYEAAGNDKRNLRVSHLIEKIEGKAAEFEEEFRL